VKRSENFSFPGRRHGRELFHKQADSLDGVFNAARKAARLLGTMQNSPCAGHRGSVSAKSRRCQGAGKVALICHESLIVYR
jgi:hypothetical protein